MDRVKSVLILICGVAVASQRPLGEEGRKAMLAAVEKLGEKRRPMCCVWTVT
jgi:hypothetical protein